MQAAGMVIYLSFVRNNCVSLGQFRMKIIARIQQDEKTQSFSSSRQIKHLI